MTQDKTKKHATRTLARGGVIQAPDVESTATALGGGHGPHVHLDVLPPVRLARACNRK